MNDTLLGVIIGGCFTAIPAVVVPWITKHSEEKRHRQDLTVQIALEQWRRTCARADAANQKVRTIPESLLNVDTDALRREALLTQNDPAFSDILQKTNELLTSFYRNTPTT